MRIKSADVDLSVLRRVPRYYSQPHTNGGKSLNALLNPGKSFLRRLCFAMAQKYIWNAPHYTKNHPIALCVAMLNPIHW